jgi:isoleucyl-tRNA synthetase
MTFKKVDPKMSFPKMEEEILSFWDENRIFEKSVAKESTAGDFIFYEGPPTANGKPGLHHVLARSFKDIIPRYKTMKGYRVARKAGWDTHGLPVELQVEKALGLRSKQEIENIVPGDARASVIEFNKRCKESVWEYRDLWEKLTKRMGYWVDMEHPYVTYENSYIESVWWQFAQIAELKNAKNESFVYKGHKVVPYCYRCGTALSSHEVAQGYKVVKDLSVTVEFELIGEPVKTSLLAWTTTPWTLPGNVALAVNKDIAYVTIEKKDEGTGELVRFVVAKDRLKDIIGEDDYDVIEEYKGEKLLGKSYEPLFDYYAKSGALKNRENGWKIYHADFITTDKGTGIAHEAPAFGEDDMELARVERLPIVHHVKMNGVFEEEVTHFASLIAKPKDNPQATDVEIIKYLAHAGALFSKEKYEHEYPFCWRCDTPLIYFAKPSWFIRMSEIRDELVKNNDGVVWVPEHTKEGRFGEWLRGAKDWAISRERYWGTPLPIWECGGAEKDGPSEGSQGPSLKKTGCGKIKVIASIAELEKLSGKKIDDVHKPYIDDVSFACECGGVMTRVPEVLDVWFDSGAMPLAQWNYPSAVTDTDRQDIEAGKYFPADYICEAIDQTRGWFYTLHAIATLLHLGGKVPVGNAFRNVICLGHIMDAQGKKMSKSKGNVIDPFQMFDEYGADPLRWMLFSLNQPGMTKRFDLKGMRDVQNRVFRMLWNSYSFFVQYAEIDKWSPISCHSREVGNPGSTHSLDPRVKPEDDKLKNLLDRWILSELQLLVKSVDESLAKYDVYAPTKNIENFIDNLSNWYIRRNRKRFWKNENDDDKNDAYQTLYDVLVTLSKLMAPFTPFVSEEIYKNLTNEESVHLSKWPVFDDGLIDEKLNEEMTVVRSIVTVGLQLRSDAKMKVRQPLLELLVTGNQLLDELADILKEELNVKNIVFAETIQENENLKIGTVGEKNIGLNIFVTENLKLEGEAREIIRAIQEGRKKAGFEVSDRIVLGYNGMERVWQGDAEKGMNGFAEEISKEILATEVKNGKLDVAEYEGALDLDGETFTFQLKRVSR